MQQRRKNFPIITYLLLSVACVISVFPLLRIMTVSFTEGDKIFSTEFSLVPDPPSAENYLQVFTDTEFFHWIFNSLLITGITAFVGVSLSATAAYALSRYRFILRNSILIFLMATQMMPAVMLLLPLYFLLQKFELINSFSGIVIAYSTTTLPFSIWLLKGYFDTIPRSLEEAGRVDGLSEVQSFWKIVLPLSTPALAIAALFSVVQIWNEYIVARVVLQSSELYTWPLGIFELQGDFDARWGMFAAASVLVALPVLAVFLYSAKWLLAGLTLGGVKG